MALMGEKNTLGVHLQHVGPWPHMWLKFVDTDRRNGGGNPNVPYSFSSLGELEAHWVESVSPLLAAQAWAVDARGCRCNSWEGGRHLAWRRHMLPQYTP